MGGRSNHIIFAYIETCKYKVLTKCPCVSFNNSCPGWGLILETEGGTQPENEYVEEGLQKVRGSGGKGQEGGATEQTACPPWCQQTTLPPTGVIKLVALQDLWVLTPGAGNWRLRKGRPPRTYLGFQVNALKITLRAREQAGSGQQSLPSAFTP